MTLVGAMVSVLPPPPPKLRDRGWLLAVIVPALNMVVLWHRPDGDEIAGDDAADIVGDGAMIHRDR